MTPSEFCALVEPHLPIGPFVSINTDRLTTACDCVRIVDRATFAWTFRVDDAARLLLGAIVEEHDDIEIEVETLTRSNCCITRDAQASDEYDYSFEFFNAGSDGTDIFAKLSAALSARAKAKETT